MFTGTLAYICNFMPWGGKCIVSSAFLFLLNWSSSHLNTCHLSWWAVDFEAASRLRLRESASSRCWRKQTETEWIFHQRVPVQLFPFHETGQKSPLIPTNIWLTRERSVVLGEHANFHPFSAEMRWWTWKFWTAVLTVSPSLFKRL